MRNYVPDLHLIRARPNCSNTSRGSSTPTITIDSRLMHLDIQSATALKSRALSKLKAECFFGGSSDALVDFLGLISTMVSVRTRRIARISLCACLQLKNLASRGASSSETSPSEMYTTRHSSSL